MWFAQGTLRELGRVLGRVLVSAVPPHTRGSGFAGPVGRMVQLPNYIANGARRCEMPRPTRICNQCGKRVGAWWERADKLQCAPCTLDDLVTEGIIRKGEPHAPGWAGMHQRRRDANTEVPR